MLIDALNDLQVIDMNNAPLQHPPTMNIKLSIAVQKYLAAATSHIQLIPLEDAIECDLKWLHKLSVSIEDFFQTNSIDKMVKMVKMVKAMRELRPK